MLPLQLLMLGVGDCGGAGHHFHHQDGELDAADVSTPARQPALMRSLALYMQMGSEAFGHKLNQLVPKCPATHLHIERQ